MVDHKLRHRIACLQRARADLTCAVGNGNARTGLLM
jgi:hypothetical protein